MNEYLKYMQAAISEAKKKSLDWSGIPIGSVLVRDVVIISGGVNTFGISQIYGSGGLPDAGVSGSPGNL